MAAWNQRIEPDATRSRGGFISDFHNVLKRLETVAWRETAFADLLVYYAESRVYVMRCKQNSPNEHLLIIKAGSEHEAISRAVFDLHKADEQIPAVDKREHMAGRTREGSMSKTLRRKWRERED